jgi:hypothetical protein
MKKLLLTWLLSLCCLGLLGCKTKIDENSVQPLTTDILLDLAAQALPCDEWQSFANFAILWTWVNREWNLMYYWVDEVMGFLPSDDGTYVRNTCYKIAPLAMEIHQSDKWFSLVSVQAVENYEGDFLIEDYNPEFDWWRLDEYVESIFSPAAFAVWQERDYWEHFPDYNDINRKNFDERAMEYFGIEAPKTEEFISYYDNWAIREVWTYVNEVKRGTWITYDEEWNVIDVQDYVNWNLVENFLPANYVVLGLDDWFEEEVNAWTLVLRWSYEDHTDYIFLTQWMWEGFLDSVNAWDEVVFGWEVYFVDWAAGSHYYNANYVEQLEIVAD